MSKELAAKIAAEVREQKEDEPKEWARLAKQSAAKKLMAAFQDQDSDAFIAALDELKETTDED